MKGNFALGLTNIDNVRRQTNLERMEVQIVTPSESFVIKPSQSIFPAVTQPKRASPDIVRKASPMKKPVSLNERFGRVKPFSHHNAYDDADDDFDFARDNNDAGMRK